MVQPSFFDNVREWWAGVTFATYLRAIRMTKEEFWAEQYRQALEHCLQPTNGGLALRACVYAHCGWVGKESACLTWKHGGELMCPHCHDNTEAVSLSTIVG